MKNYWIKKESDRVQKEFVAESHKRTMKKGYHDVGEFYKDEEEFVWTDELVGEYGEYYRNAQETRKFWGVNILDEFKQLKSAQQSKASPTDDVKNRITAFRDRHGLIWTKKNVDCAGDIFCLPYEDRGYPIDKMLSPLPNEFEIYSALSKDKVEWKIGDLASGCGLTNSEIKGFEIHKSNNYLMVQFGRNKNDSVNIDYITKPEERVPLFTTEDGVEIYADTPFVNFVYVINSDGLSVAVVAVSKSIANVLHGKKIFSTEQKALQYLANNRKVLLTIEEKNFYEGDIVPFVVDFTNTGEAIFDEWNLHYRDIGRGLTFFLTRESAEKWIAYNQKSISYQQLLEYIESVESKLNCNQKFPALDMLNNFRPKHTK